jgi:hypothetical protein
LISPTTFADIGLHTVDIMIADGQPLSKTITFKINAINNPPYFVDQVPYPISIKFNLTYEYMLPKAKDDEGNAIYYYILSDPSVDDFLV